MGATSPGWRDAAPVTPNFTSAVPTLATLPGPLESRAVEAAFPRESEPYCLQLHQDSAHLACLKPQSGDASPPPTAGVQDPGGSVPMTAVAPGTRRPVQDRTRQTRAGLDRTGQSGA